MKLWEFLKEEYENIHLKEPHKLRNKKIFITGTNGLIGANILSYLHFLNQSQNYAMQLYAHSFSKPESWLPQDKNITYFYGDLNSFVPGFQFDFFIHCATYAQPKKVFEHQFSTIELNTTTYIKLLECAKANKAKVLCLSSSAIYGDICPDKLPIEEEYQGILDLNNSASLYAQSKRMSELISFIYIEQGLDLKIARLAICYGPGVRINDKRFLIEFITQALKNQKITLMDKGQALRQLNFVSDWVEMLLNILLSGKKHIYNVASNEANTIYEFANSIASLTSASVELPKLEKGVRGAQDKLLVSIKAYQDEFNKKDFVPTHSSSGGGGGI